MQHQAIVVLQQDVAGLTATVIANHNAATAAMAAMQQTLNQIAAALPNAANSVEARRREVALSNRNSLQDGGQAVLLPLLNAQGALPVVQGAWPQGVQGQVTVTLDTILHWGSPVVDGVLAHYQQPVNGTLPVKRQRVVDHLCGQF